MQSNRETPVSTQISTNTSPTTHDPVLTSDDEAFFRQIMSRPDAAGLDTGNAVTADAPGPVAQDNQNAEEFGKKLGEQQRKATDLEEQEKSGDKDRNKEQAESTVEGKKKRWSLNWPWGKGKKKAEKSDDANETPDRGDSKDKDATKDQDQLQQSQQAEAATETSAPADKPADDDMAEILEQLNLAAENNRIFSASDEMQELLRKFKLIFKDLINGVPTAYHDLEMLFKNGNNQLQDTYSKMPSFLQRLIEKLPEKWTDSLAPEVLAAASEKAAKNGVNTENVAKAAAAADKMGLKVPSLKELVGKPAAIVGMLRSIVAFLKARFPAVIGVNVLWSLALSILLFVLWYCHKRGREVRLENERLVTEEEIRKMNEQMASEERPIRATETLTTTAPPGAAADMIRDGVREVERTRETVRTSTANPEATEAEVAGHGTSGTEVAGDENAAPVPTRTKSRLSIFSRSGKKASKAEPYPGT
ncbi:uncharacterized protein ACHE_20231A [Aspergillus chevalieri]|uniref:Uncharacterized protein n=1 Tax=Aspergillus chevalieri TaxID=182096 RepID=A0A7R7VJ10_ASPCH|nr:uncharacterized protein ACHE_20231A [Aspergillus chevalieri]BCR84773.1 hypothetical protein ACHE_20231A [Aspergillus chevalieri]